MNGPSILAFSGGLDTCAILLWLKENYHADVIAYHADLGNAGDVGAIKERAIELGATEFISDNLQAEFLKDYVWPTLQAGATYQKDYLLGTAVARPLIAQRMAQVAKAHGASAIAHGATGKGNDQIRFEKTWSYLIPNIEILAPWKVWSFKGRNDLLNYLDVKGFAFDFPNKTFSIDENLFHISYEGGPLESLHTSYLDVLPQLAPMATGCQEITLGFANGALVSVAGDREIDAKNDPVAAMEALNQWGSAFAIGIEDIVEERYNGIKSRGVYVSPGGAILAKALTQLKQICWDHESFALAQYLGTVYGDFVYAGDWFSPAKKALDHFFTNLAGSLLGEVTLRLQPHSVCVVRRSSPLSLYHQDLVSFDSDTDGVNLAAKGFCDTINYRCKVQGLGQSLRGQL